MSVFKCKMCGGSLNVESGQGVITCDYCGTQQTSPKTYDDVIANLFNRANNLRLKNEFDKAQEVYEKIISAGSNDSEAYWGSVLCKYGIEYVEDPATFRRIPTCHRTQLESVLSDVDYNAAITNADEAQRSIYEKEAKEIDELQKNILRISQGEAPFDVFICYKETDENGKRTPDSVIANDIYHQLTTEGFKVFYSAITLEDKLGQEYEPYIFSALNSARVMLVVGTKPEFFNAVWVRNEWSRFLKIVKNDRTKALIPCYKDMDAYDLPEEFSHLQAQDMSKIGFITDIVRGIKKLLAAAPAAPAAPSAPTIINNTANDPAVIYSRAMMAFNNKDEASLKIAKQLFDSISYFRDSKEKSKTCEKLLNQNKTKGKLLIVVLCLALIIVGLFVVKGLSPKKSTTTQQTTAYATTAQQTTKTQSTYTVRVDNIKINTSESDTYNDYVTINNPINRIYFHFNINLTNKSNIDLLTVLIWPNGESYEYVMYDMNPGSACYYYGSDTASHWSTGKYQFYIYNNETKSMLLSTEFYVGNASYSYEYTMEYNLFPTQATTQAPQTTKAAAPFKTLTYSGVGFKAIPNIDIPDGLYVIRFKGTVPSRDNNKFYVNLYNAAGETVEHNYAHVYPDEPVDTQATFNGPVDNGKLVIDAESGVSWTVTIEAI